LYRGLGYPQWQPQVFGVQPQPRLEPNDWPFDFAELPDALKTESFKVWRPLSHCGQAIFDDLDMTSCS